MDLFHTCLLSIERVLRDTNFNKEQIHQVVLVGGSSRIPKVIEILQGFFDEKTLNKSLNPDEVITEFDQIVIITNMPVYLIINVTIINQLLGCCIWCSNQCSFAHCAQNQRSTNCYGRTIAPSWPRKTWWRYAFSSSTQFFVINK